jgi:hypothetical protein
MPAKKTQQEMDAIKNNRYTDGSNLEAHIIADMLRIESITAELREFKEDTKARLNKIEGWIIAIVGTTVTTLIATVASLVIKIFG